jgi:hypothetical protein
MGAWGHGPFDNDAALDWLQGAVEELDAAIRSALGTAVAGGYLEVDEGSAAVAAAALAAAALDGDTRVVPERARGALGAWTPDDEVRSLAVRALEAATGAASELASLWSADEAWKSGIADLLGRLRSA